MYLYVTLIPYAQLVFVHCPKYIEVLVFTYVCICVHVVQYMFMHTCMCIDVSCVTNCYCSYYALLYAVVIIQFTCISVLYMHSISSVSLDGTVYFAFNDISLVMCLYISHSYRCVCVFHWSVYM